GVQAGCDYHFGAGFLIGVQGDYAWRSPKAVTIARARSVSLITAKSNRWRASPAGSVTLGGAFSATSKVAAPGSATITGRQRLSSARPTRRVRRGRDGL